MAELVLAEQRGAVGVARLNRPDARNALSPELMEELASILEGWDASSSINSAESALRASGRSSCASPMRSRTSARMVLTG